MYPRSMVYFRCIIANTLHNCDNKYINNYLTHIASFVEDIQHPERFVYILQYISLVKICCLPGEVREMPCYF
jgi:hypothetical protein